MTVTVTDQLLHQLVTGSHAEGTTRLAVAAAIEHNDRTLLIAAVDDDFETLWQLPFDLVLPQHGSPLWLASHRVPMAARYLD